MLQRYLLPVIADDAGRKQLPKGHQLIVFKIVMQRRGLLQTLRQMLLKSVKSFTLVFPTQQIGYDTMVKTDNLSKLFPKLLRLPIIDRKSTRLNSSHVRISYAVFCLK